MRARAVSIDRPIGQAAVEHRKAFYSWITGALLDQEFRDLNAVEGGAFAQLVADHPEV